jgi:hypothetical protein
MINSHPHRLIVLINCLICSCVAVPTLTHAAQTAKAAFVGIDTTTQGNWRGKYGTEGYQIIGDSASSSPPATFTPSSYINATWASSTLDQRALQKAPPATDRIAACWSDVYTPNPMVIQVAVNDGGTHQVALYFLDWDCPSTAGRILQVQVTDLNNIILATEIIDGFSTGKYMIWNVSGSVKFILSMDPGSTCGNPVISGWFLDPIPSATFVGIDTTTQGTWLSAPQKYGTQAYRIANGSSDYSWLPPQLAYVTVGGSSCPSCWAPSTTDPRALQRPPNGADRVANCWFSTTSFDVDVTINDGNLHQLALYFLDWDCPGPITRIEEVQVTDVVTGKTLDSRAIDAFTGGKYMIWNVRGHVKFTLTMSGINVCGTPVLSAWFLDPIRAQISPISDKTTKTNLQTGNIYFTVSHPTVSPIGLGQPQVTSGDTTVVPNGNISLTTIPSATGASQYSIRITPTAPSIKKIVPITVSVNDGTATGIQKFNLTVDPDPNVHVYWYTPADFVGSADGIDNILRNTFWPSGTYIYPGHDVYINFDKGYYRTRGTRTGLPSHITLMSRWTVNGAGKDLTRVGLIDAVINTYGNADRTKWTGENSVFGIYNAGLASELDGTVVADMTVDCNYKELANNPALTPNLYLGGLELAGKNLTVRNVRVVNAVSDQCRSTNCVGCTENFTIDVVSRKQDATNNLVENCDVLAFQNDYITGNCTAINVGSTKATIRGCSVVLNANGKGEYAFGAFGRDAVIENNHSVGAARGIFSDTPQPRGSSSVVRNNILDVTSNVTNALPFGIINLCVWDTVFENNIINLRATNSTGIALSGYMNQYPYTNIVESRHCLISRNTITTSGTPSCTGINLNPDFWIDSDPSRSFHVVAPPLDMAVELNRLESNLNNSFRSPLSGSSFLFACLYGNTDLSGNAPANFPAQQPTSCGFSASAPVVPAPANMQLWLRADAGVAIGTQGVQQWDDQSGHGNHVYQNTNNCQPQRVWAYGPNGQDMIHFDGNSNYLAALGQVNLTSTGGTWVAIVRPSTPTLSPGMVLDNLQCALAWKDLGDNTGKFGIDIYRGSTWIDNTGGPFVGPYPKDQIYLVMATFDTTGSGQYRSYVNGTMVQNINSGAGVLSVEAQNTLQIGRAPWGNYLKGDIAEVIIYNKVLSAVEESQLRMYASRKYGILVPTATPPPTYTTVPPPPASLNYTNGLVLWLKADAGVVKGNKSEVTVWQDQSPNSPNTASVSTPYGPSWVDNGPNLPPTIRFNGVNQYMETATNVDLSTAQGGSWVVLLRPSVAYGGDYPTTVASILDNRQYAMQWKVQEKIFGMDICRLVNNNPTWLDSTGGPYTGPYTPDQFYLVICTYDKNNGAYQIYVNGANVPPTPTPPITAVPLATQTGYETVKMQIGRSPFGNYFLGDIAEILIYNAPLSQANRWTVQNYIASKYRLNIPQQ